MARLRPDPHEKLVIWVGSSRRDLLRLPSTVVDAIGHAISFAQFGGKHSSAKPWRGAGSGVLEIVQDYEGDAYRAIYTVQFAGTIYVLHCFQKKSPSGARTGRRDIGMVSARLQIAKRDFEENHDKRQG